MASTALGSAAAPARAGLTPQNGILGSNPKPFMRFSINKARHFGLMPLRMRGSVASSPRKVFSPKAAGAKSGDEGMG